MQFSDIIRTRRSIRRFTDQQIPRETLLEIVEEAQRTPSWANSQPWRVRIATGRTLEGIKADHLAASQRGERGRPDFSTMHREAWDPASRRNMGHWNAHLQDYLGPEHGADFGAAQQELFDATAIVYLSISQDASLWSVFDLGAFSQTLMYSAVDRGLGTMSAYETVKFPHIVREHMEIPDEDAVAMGIALGYPAEHMINQFITDREPLEKMLTIKS